VSHVVSHTAKATLVNGHFSFQDQLDSSPLHNRLLSGRSQVRALPESPTQSSTKGPLAACPGNREAVDLR
jgi:hypothetical protein